MNGEYREVWLGLSWAAFIGAGIRAAIAGLALRLGEASQPDRAARGLRIYSAIALLGGVGLLVLWLVPS